MNKSDETSWVSWRRRVRYVARRYPLAILAFAAVYFYLADCVVAHGSHPEVSWIESGVYCRGPFGFVATVGIVVVGIGYCLKRGL
jgi:hypothetical protein